MIRTLPVLVALALGVAGSAAAQEIDPIGALLERTQPAAVQPAPALPSPETAPAQPPAEAPPPAVQDVAPAPAPTPPAATYPAPPSVVRLPPPASYPPPSYPSPSSPPPARSQPGGPIRVDETGRTPDGPPSDSDRNYEARMRASFAASQGLQGPLDGHWVVRVDGAVVYDLQLVDKSSGVLEGAWRDPRRRAATDASGFLDQISRDGGRVIARFTPRPGADPAVLTLQEAGYGAWTGELVESGERRAVTMRRD